MDEGDRPDAGGGGASGAMFAQAAFHHGRENAQHRALQGRVALKEVAQPLGTASTHCRTGSGGKRFWLLPAVVILALFAILLFLRNGKEIAPFIRTIFQCSVFTEYFSEGTG